VGQKEKTVSSVPSLKTAADKRIKKNAKEKTLDKNRTLAERLAEILSA
jgi:hypothetical protein